MYTADIAVSNPVLRGQDWKAEGGGELRSSRVVMEGWGDRLTQEGDRCGFLSDSVSWWLTGSFEQGISLVTLHLLVDELTSPFLLW